MIRGTSETFEIPRQRARLRAHEHQIKKKHHSHDFILHLTHTRSVLRKASFGFSCFVQQAHFYPSDCFFIINPIVNYREREKSLLAQELKHRILKELLYSPEIETPTFLSFLFTSGYKSDMGFFISR